MIKKILATKAYVFLGTLLTAGLITGITYNIILASNEKNNVISSNEQQNEIDDSIISTDKDQYNDLQEQVDELKVILEATQTELIETKQDLASTQNKVNSLNTQINNLKKNNNEKVNLTNSSTQQIISEDKIKQLEDISVKDNKQKELIKQKENMENEYNVLWKKTCEHINLTGRKNQIETSIEYKNSDIKSLLKTNSSLSSYLHSEQIQKNIKEIERLEKEIDELEIQLQEINEEIKIKAPTEEEEERRLKLPKEIGQIKEELLKY